MSDATTHAGAAVAPEPPTSGEPHAAPPGLGWALAGMSAGAGAIHFAMTPIHAASGWQDTLGFAAAGWFQLITAAMVLMGRAGRRTYQAMVAANLVFIGVWAWSRTAGLPWGEDPGVAESAAAIDVVCVVLEVGVVLAALRLLLAPASRSAHRLAPALAAVGAIALATVVITSPDAAEHGHAADDEPTGLAALEAEVDDTRCDRDFNIPAYWQEASYLGIDTRWGGTPPAVEGEAPASGGHSHGGSTTASGGTTTTTDPDPFEGRGSVGLDKAISATGLAATSEGEAARLVSLLSETSEDDYDAWLRWLRTSGSLAHEHAAPTGGDQEVSGHGGHVGPQPWVALTDQAQCDQLAEELALARETAMKYPTAGDAREAGYVLVTGYVPGIAAHFIKYDILDDTFEVDQPEMILYDGAGDDASVVGLSYYLVHPGNNPPTQGFTGDNDHGHRHIGLCSDDSGRVIGDSALSAEDCEARGGSKGDGSQGWMSHAWVVPGCESPWGVFSAATPVLDHKLPRQSGQDGGGCAASSVRERYDLDQVAKRSASAGETTDTAGG